MFSPSQLEAIYAFMTAFDENPRMTLKQLHKKCSSYSAISSTSALLKRAQENYVFIGPRLFVNAHLDVILVKIEDVNMEEYFRLWNNSVSDSKVRYAIMLAGGHALLTFKRGATLLTFAEAVKPTYPSTKTIFDIQPLKKGKLKKDIYPKNWNELDWQVYEYAKYPAIPLLKISEKLDVSWHTVKEHYNKIKKDCKTWHSFFPKGQMNYYHGFLTFKSEYEVGIRDELKKLDRTSFLYKFQETLILYLMLDDQRQINRFYDLEKEGIIHGLRVSSPIQWHKPDVLI